MKKVYEKYKWTYENFHNSIIKNDSYTWDKINRQLKQAIKEQAEEIFKDFEKEVQSQKNYRKICNKMLNEERTAIYTANQVLKVIEELKKKYLGEEIKKLGD